MNIFENRHRGFEVKRVRPDFEVVCFDVFEASPKMITLSNYEPDVLELIKRADIINGVAFSKLTDVMYFKLALGRDKDKKDIELIKNHLAKKS